MSGDRYFGATAMGQRLYVDGLSDHGDWDPGRLIFYPSKSLTCC
jgi:hypothetical protein